MTRFIKIVVIVIGLVVITYYGILSTQMNSTNTISDSQNPADRKPAPQFALKDLNGKDVALSDYKGKVVLINFWATWCIPCKDEIPEFIDAQQNFQKDGFTVIGISQDEGGAKDV